jgi:hypothetical protein
MHYSTEYKNLFTCLLIFGITSILILFFYNGEFKFVSDILFLPISHILRLFESQESFTFNLSHKTSCYHENVRHS